MNVDDFLTLVTAEIRPSLIYSGQSDEAFIYALAFPWRRNDRSQKRGGHNEHEHEFDL